MKKNGFTLIELLVVIAIVSILAAILFPVFSRVREKGRQTSCLSNTKQIALGILQYSGDYDETLPPVAYEDAAGDEHDWLEMLEPYLKSEQIFKCPSDSKAEESSYGLNEIAFVDLEDGPAPAVKLSQFQTPAQTLMLGEAGTEDDFTTLRDDDSLKLVAPSAMLNDDDDGRPAVRHLERVNIAFMDGHSKALRLDQFYRGQTPQDLYFTP